MTGHLPNLQSSMREPDFMELVWENGEVLIRGLSSKKTKNSSPFSSRYLSESSKDGVATESTLAVTIPDSEPQKESVADEQSEAVPNTKLAQDNTGFKGSPERIVASSSFCSLAASNCPAYTLQEDTDDLSQNTEMEEQEDKTQGTKGCKRKRKTEVHNLSERKRRDKINKKMRALKELIPNCNKVDKVSMLDEAIEYLKNLKFQMMSIGNGVYMPPMMFPSPSAMQHVNAQYLGGFYPMMAMRMQMGLGPQFHPPLVPGTAALPNEVSMPRSPFVYSVGSFTPQSVLPYRVGLSQSAAATVVAGQVDRPAGPNLTER